MQAQGQLGALYRDGDGNKIKQNPKLALHWLTLSAENVHDESADCLADMYLVGQAVEKDAVQAAFWYRKGADRKYKDVRRYVLA
jgi:TPR repeat protein